jgi:hypothetical protein
MTTPGKPAVGGTVMRIPAIQSPNFQVSPLAGWALFQDGRFYAADATISGTVSAGTFEGTDFVINASGAFFYSATPAAGNLINSVTATGGTDGFGNAYLAGISSYDNLFGIPAFATSSNGGIVQFYSWTGTAWAVSAYISTSEPGPNGLMILNGDMQVQNSINSVNGTSSDPTLITTDNWTTVTSFSAGFSAGGVTPQYALEPTGIGGKGNIRLRGQIILTGATAADSPMFSLPYAFTRNQDYVTPNNLSGYSAGQRVVRIAASGTVRCEPVGSNTNFVLLDGIVAPMS